jgi:hypothetical protein
MQTELQRTGSNRRSLTETGARRARAKFLRFFARGFYDETYIAWERDYKWHAHEQWQEALNRHAFKSLLRTKRFDEIAAHAVWIESRTNLLFSFEKMALRDAVKTVAGAQQFAEGLYDLLYGRGAMPARFDKWCEVVAALPRKQTRVLTWPVVTVFGFLAQPDIHFFLKPNVTRLALRLYGLNFAYHSRPSATTYSCLLDLATAVRSDLADLRPRDMIDIQSFLWVQGSDEYEE